MEVFARNRYVGRTFIQPSTRLRRLGVAKKYGPLVENFKGDYIKDAKEYHCSNSVEYIC